MKNLIICKKIKYSLLFYISCLIFSFIVQCIISLSNITAQDLVQLKLVGHWSNNYGEFHAVEVLRGEVFQEYGHPGSTYAFCATSKGMAIFCIRPKNEDPSNKIQEVSLVSFVPIDNCSDIVMQIDEQGHEKNVYAYITAGSKGLYIRNITNPVFSYHMGTCATPGWAEGVAVSGDYAYVAAGDRGLQIIDVHNKNGPVIIGSCDTPDSALEVAVSGDYAYVADGSSGLKVIDIHNKNGPVIMGSCDTPDSARGIAVSGDYAYVADGYSGLQVIDVHNKNGPVIVGSCDTPDSAQGVAVLGDYAYVADRSSGLQVIDIHNMNGPVIAGTSDIPYYALGIVVLGDHAYMATGYSGLQIIDIHNKNGPVIIGSSDPPDFALRVAISGDYIYVADGYSGLQIIDIHNKNRPVIVGSCDTTYYALGVVVSGDYAYVVDGSGGLQIIDIHNKNEPIIVGSYDTPDSARGIAVSGNYAYVADGSSGLQIIDIHNKNRPVIVGSCDTPYYALGVAVSGDYAYVADGSSGLQIVDIHDKHQPDIVGSCLTPELDSAEGVAVSEQYAYVAARYSGIQVINILNKNEPIIVGSSDTPDSALGVALSGDYAYVVDGFNGLLQFRIQIGPSPRGKGNLILVAGGNINYRALSQQRPKTVTSPRFKLSSVFNSQSSTWQITQALATHVLKTFLSKGYDICDIYYFNPDPLQDIDNDGIPNQLIIDDSTPTPEDLQEIIKSWPEGHIANDGPLYIYLIGYAAEDRFLIMSDQIITAQELRNAIDSFQNGYTDDEGIYHPGTSRQVVVIIEAAASGTFINDLTGPNITVITSTGTGASYIKPLPIELSPSSTGIPYTGFTNTFVNTFAPSLDPNNIPDCMSEDVPSQITQSLREAFLTARYTIESKGHPFTDQSPQMCLPGSRFSALHFSKDGMTPIAQEPLTILSRNDIPLYLTLIGEIPNHSYYPLSPEKLITFCSSNTNILNPLRDVKKEGDWYYLNPQENGLITLIAHADPNMPLSAKITIEISIDASTYPEDSLETGRMAIIAAGYKGTGDYLWESTNTIANHAYKTLRAMGYTKKEITYYSPFFLQDLDENGTFDDIDGYPRIKIFDPNVCDSTVCSPFARIMNSDSKINELFIFLADHGNRGTFSINPIESLFANDLINQIASIKDKINDKIILLYDACYSGSFIEEIKQRQDPNLSQKLLTITSTGPNQIAYYLNRGLVSFSYSFLDEWRLTHSLKGTFDYAGASLPYADPNQGQTPCISDPNLAEKWD